MRALGGPATAPLTTSVVWCGNDPRRQGSTECPPDGARRGIADRARAPGEVHPVFERARRPAPAGGNRVRGSAGRYPSRTRRADRLAVGHHGASRSASRRPPGAKPMPPRRAARRRDSGDAEGLEALNERRKSARGIRHPATRRQASSLVPPTAGISPTADFDQAGL